MGIDRTVVDTNSDYYQDSSPTVLEDGKCISTNEKSTLHCVKVSSTGDENCIQVDGDVPYIDIEPDVTPPDITVCTEPSERPDFSITLVNGEAPVLNVNKDDKDKIYIKVGDVVTIEITNYDANFTYDTPYTSEDILSSEGIEPSEVLVDNEDGTLTYTFNDYNATVDGIDIEIWIYVTDNLGGCRNISEKWVGMQSMERSSQPILDNTTITFPNDCIVKIDNFNSLNTYSQLNSSLEDVDNNFSIVDGKIVFTPDNSSYYELYKSIFNTFIVEIKSTEPLKYISLSGECTVEAIFIAGGTGLIRFISGVADITYVDGCPDTFSLTLLVEAQANGTGVGNTIDVSLDTIDSFGDVITEHYDTYCGTPYYDLSYTNTTAISNTGAVQSFLSNKSGFNLFRRLYYGSTNSQIRYVASSDGFVYPNCELYNLIIEAFFGAGVILTETQSTC